MLKRLISAITLLVKKKITIKLKMKKGAIVIFFLNFYPGGGGGGEREREADPRPSLSYKKLFFNIAHHFFLQNKVGLLNVQRRRRGVRL